MVTRLNCTPQGNADTVDASRASLEPSVPREWRKTYSSDRAAAHVNCADQPHAVMPADHTDLDGREAS
jgi:hypothetical protein